MKIIVIGSKGFIGSNIYDFYSSKKNIELWQCDILPNTEHADNYFCLVNIQPDFDTLFKNQNYDICINASGTGNVGLSFIQPLNDFMLNSGNICKILEAIRVYNPTCKFINFSSAAVYGNPETLPVAETYPIKPLSPYGFHKSIAEQLCSEYHHFFGIKTCNLRVFSAYGPGLKKQLFWDIYKKNKTADKIIELFGTGNETRDFIYIDDLVTAITMIVEKSTFNGECINVASGIEITIRTAANYFQQYMQFEKEIIFNGHIKKGDPLNWKADISSLHLLGFKPTTGIEEGILKYAQWIINNNL